MELWGQQPGRNTFTSETTKCYRSVLPVNFSWLRCIRELMRCVVVISNACCCVINCLVKRLVKKRYSFSISVTLVDFYHWSLAFESPRHPFSFSYLQRPLLVVTTPVNLFFGLPFFPLPSSSIFNIMLPIYPSSLRGPCPNHLDF